MEHIIKNKIKYKLPEENVEYTFIFPGNKVITYVYAGLTETGRVILMNVKTKRFTPFSPGWFSRMRKNQLIRTRKIETEAKGDNKTLSSSVPNSTLSQEEKIIQELRNLSPVTALEVSRIIKRNPSELADDLEKLFASEEDAFTPEYVNRVCNEMIKARDYYLNK